MYDTEVTGHRLSQTVTVMLDHIGLFHIGLIACSHLPFAQTFLGLPANCSASPHAPCCLYVFKTPWRVGFDAVGQSAVRYCKTLPVKSRSCLLGFALLLLLQASAAFASSTLLMYRLRQCFAMCLLQGKTSPRTWHQTPLILLECTFGQTCGL